MKPKLLFITTQIPSDKYAAGARTSLKKLRDLSTIYEITLLMLISDGQTNNNQLGNSFGFTEVDDIHIFKFSRLKKILNVIFSKRSPLLFRFTNRYDRRGRDFISLWSKRNKDGCYFFDHSESLIYLTPEIEKKSEVLLADIITQRSLRETNLSSLSSASDYNFEVEAYSRVQKVFVQTMKDKEILKSLLNIENVEIFEPELSSFVNNVQRNPSQIKPYSLLFWGALHRKENEESIIKFVERFWLKLSLRLPEINLNIVGINPSAKLYKVCERYSNINITGYVDDPTPFFESAHIGIAPLLSGAGVKVKVLEMLRCGIPILGTPISAEGIFDENLTISEIDDFDDILLNMLLNEKYSIEG